MSEETASAPAEAPTTASEGDSAPVEHASAPVEGGEGVTIEATAEPGADTIMLGDVAVPLAALADLPDDVLRNLRRTVRVNGEDREVSIADALSAVSKAEGADAKMREAARQRKEAEAALARVMQDPIAAIAQIAQMNGSTPEEARALLEQRLLEQYEYEALDPAERAKVEARREMERKARAFEEYQRAEQERQAQAQHQQHVETMRSQMSSALERAGVAGDAHVFSRAVSIMRGLVTAKGDIPDAQLAAAMDKAVGLAADELGKARASWLDVDDDAVLLERIPEAVQRKIARAYAARAKQATASPRRPAGAPKAAKQPERKMTTDEWRAWLADRDAAAG